MLTFNFNSLPGRGYPVGTGFTVSDVTGQQSITINAVEFLDRSGNVINTGWAEVHSGINGVGQALYLNNIGLEFEISSIGSNPYAEGVELHFRKCGWRNLNIEINGDFRNFENFADLSGTVFHSPYYGDVVVSVVNGFGSDQGLVTFAGQIERFRIGGEGDVNSIEGLWINAIDIQMDAPVYLIDFEDLVLDKVIYADCFESNGVTVHPTDFEGRGGQIREQGLVQNCGRAGGTGQELQLYKTLLDFDVNSLGNSAARVEIRFWESGGTFNLWINHVPLDPFDKFSQINGCTFDGVTISLSSGFGGGPGVLTLQGRIDEFAIGAERGFVIDHVYLWYPHFCLVNFEDLSLGEKYGYLGEFMTSGIRITPREFQDNNGPFYDGFAEVIRFVAGQKMELKNIGLDFDISSTGLGSVAKRLTFRYDEYDGYLNLRINRDFQPFENFDELNGREVGGVDVSVINGVDHMGAIVLEGDIDDFAIGGEELWIDDVCLWY